MVPELNKLYRQTVIVGYKFCRKIQFVVANNNEAIIQGDIDVGDGFEL